MNVFDERNRETENQTSLLTTSLGISFPSNLVSLDHISYRLLNLDLTVLDSPKDRSEHILQRLVLRYLGSIEHWSQSPLHDQHSFTNHDP